MSAFFPESKEDFEKNLKNIREFCYLKIQYALMKVGPEDHIQVECKKCRHRTLVEVGKPMGIDAVVEMIMEWVKNSEIARLTLLAAMADSIKDDGNK